MSYAFLECPPGLVLNDIYDDPNNMKVLCTETPQSPPPNIGGGNGSPFPRGDEPPPPPPSGGSPPPSGGGDEPPPPQGGPPPSQPGNICPNGYTAMGNYLNGTPANSCEPIVCPTGYTPADDSQGTKGCADSTGNIYVCPSGTSLYIGEFNQQAPSCRMNSGLNNAGDPMTGNNFGVCPTDYNKAQYTDICQYASGEGSAPFTNVNGFKSKKGRNVESFSQNTNGKCKARY